MGPSERTLIIPPAAELTKAPVAERPVVLPPRSDGAQDVVQLIQSRARLGSGRPGGAPDRRHAPTYCRSGATNRAEGHQRDEHRILLEAAEDLHGGASDPSASSRMVARPPSLTDHHPSLRPRRKLVLGGQALRPAMILPMGCSGSLHVRLATPAEPRPRPAGSAC